MSKWKEYISEVAPVAIGVVFLLAIAVKPDISLPHRKDTFEAIVKEHFWREIAFQRNIPKLPALKEMEELLIAEALKRADGNQTIAAQLLGISRKALNNRLNRAR